MNSARTELCDIVQWKELPVFESVESATNAVIKVFALYMLLCFLSESAVVYVSLCVCVSLSLSVVLC